MAELKPFEVIMRIDYAASKGPEVVAHAEKVQDLVRCKDCKFYEKGHGCDLLDVFMLNMDDWFCADGERREQ